MPFWSSMLCPIPYEEVMPYALNFPVNELGNHEKVCPIIEYALSWYMPYMRVNCICFMNNGYVFQKVQNIVRVLLPPV